MNGKGDKSRVRDAKRYRENFDAIRWRKKEVCNVSFVDYAGRWQWKQKAK